MSAISGAADPPVQDASAVGGFVVAFSLAMLGVGLLLRVGEPAVAGMNRPPLIGPIGLVAFALPGSFLVSRRASSTVGWYVVAIGAVLGFGWLVGEYAAYAGDPDPGGLPGVLSARELARITVAPALASLPGLLLLLPDGRVMARRWRPAAAVAVAAFVAVAASAWTAGDERAREVLPGFDHLSGGDRPVDNVAIVVLVVSTFLGVLSLFHRMVRAGGVERLQLRMILFGAAITGGLLAISPAASAGTRPLVVATALVPLPVALAVAHVRHRLWLVDLVINRAMVFAALAAGVIAITALVVAVLGGPLGERTGAPVISLAVLVALMQPAHQAVQRAVNRLFYGDGQEPSRAIAAVARDLDTAHGVRTSLRAAALTVARALRLPYVAIATADGTREAVGEAEGPVVQLALVHGDDVQGWLLVTPRVGESQLRAGDLRLLEDLARQIAVVVHAGTLRQDLQRSRERLVAAREEERRRLRRDLHDELGPSLAAVALQLEAVRDHADPDMHKVLANCEQRLRECVDDVRRIVDDLGPSQVDELGLVGALNELAARFRTTTATVEVAAAIDRILPAAVEVAAYRIASEAVTNAMKHGAPNRVLIDLATVDGVLRVRVVDDGGGELIETDRGVGVRSMRERAEELGGSARSAGTGAGVEVVATLPIASDEGNGQTRTANGG